MVYKPNIPQSNDFISQSQQDMIANFGDVHKFYGLPSLNDGDHVPFTEGDDDLKGKHKKLTLIEQGAAPATGANEMAVYTKDVGGSPEIFVREESSGDEIQMTGGGLINMNGLVLRAHVIFDVEGNIIEREILDENDEIQRVPISHNVSDVTATKTMVGSVVTDIKWKVTFETAMPDANYFWNVTSFNFSTFSGSITFIRQVQPANNAAYGDTVKTTDFTVQGITNTLGNDYPRTFERILVSIYTLV